MFAVIELYLNMSIKKLWIYPLSFGIIGAFIGLVLRYAFTGGIGNFPFKNVLHSHSHVMLLGLVFNAMFLLIWQHFTLKMNKVTKQYFVVLQVFMYAMMVAFIIQGYALYSIIFSTIHLWLSYILLIRLWKNLNKKNPINTLVKAGIILHFLSSLGPYALGPLMAFNMKSSPWYQQAIFFYLHFQFFGVYFCWLLALFGEKIKYNFSKSQVIIIVTGLVLLYSHSLDYSFNNYWINFFGGVGAAIILGILIKMISAVGNAQKPIKLFYVVLFIIALINVLGAFPVLANLVTNNRFILIAWLHLLFLGMYLPFIWIYLSNQIKFWQWLFYILSVVFSELLLIFPAKFTAWTGINSMQLLFICYFMVFLGITMVHVKYIKSINKSVATIN